MVQAVSAALDLVSYLSRLWLSTPIDAQACGFYRAHLNSSLLWLEAQS